MGADEWAALLLLAALLALLLLAAVRRLVWRPRAVARSFARQGIRGPPYRFLAGSLPEAKRLAVASWRGVPPLDVGSHDIMPLLLPPFHRWVADYGRTFLYWIGPIPAIFSTDLELIKEVLTDRTGLFAKDFMVPILKVLLGNGLILANGEDWKRHRKVVLPAFNHERIKSMSAVTAEATEQMTKRWCDQILQSGARQAAEIHVDRAISDLTAEIIGRVAFGTSHQEAGEVLRLMHQMQEMGAAAMLDAPILWHLPTRRNLKVRRLDKLLRIKIVAMMEARVAAKDAYCVRGGGGYGDDLLGLMLEAWSPERHGSDGTLTTEEVIDECKTFFGAGQETTATLLVWTMFLLSTHPQWQEKVREEVLREFSGDDDGGAVVPNTDVLAKLKLLHMVLLETLRLYPPIVFIQRTTACDVVLRGINVPRGTAISIPIGMLQRDKEVWGSDADKFNPMRFKNGVSRAGRDPNALLSFSLGPRACTGQSFGVVEAQIVMAMILRKFSFSLSPTYVHKPKYVVSLTPNRGMPLILRNLDG
ncbi:Cytochrome P450 709B2 [Dichanthelium oligosanthes]|uniref:Cytochrome P450 709B2 n=1 Tax=Dichanthelium oligosanthes TaxID=888268 RepID=A0A1E5VGQ2_9POAL|nr:Cytochrome P450 709B2 [Dichanthelium oligosanthes]